MIHWLKLTFNYFWTEKQLRVLIQFGFFFCSFFGTAVLLLCPSYLYVWLALEGPTVSVQVPRWVIGQFDPIQTWGKQTWGTSEHNRVWLSSMYKLTLLADVLIWTNQKKKWIQTRILPSITHGRPFQKWGFADGHQSKVVKRIIIFNQQLYSWLVYIRDLGFYITFFIASTLKIVPEWASCSNSCSCLGIYWFAFSLQSCGVSHF